jgi:hypothetical protein
MTFGSSVLTPRPGGGAYANCPARGLRRAPPLAPVSQGYCPARVNPQGTHRADSV